MPIDALREAVRAGEIDTVIVAMTDMQGRLQGKRFHARFFLDEVAAKAFGEDVVAHYGRAAEVELEAFQKAVTDWERFRGFERL